MEKLNKKLLGFIIIRLMHAPISESILRLYMDFVTYLHCHFWFYIAFLILRYLHAFSGLMLYFFYFKFHLYVLGPSTTYDIILFYIHIMGLKMAWSKGWRSYYWDLYSTEIINIINLLKSPLVTRHWDQEAISEVQQILTGG